MTVRTWHVELTAVAAALAGMALVTGSRLAEWVGALAVLASFAHGQVTDRLAEREAARARPAVRCHRWARGYFVAKESLWVAYFVAHRSWSALVGCALFLAYPAWRAWWRARYPLAGTDSDASPPKSTAGT